MAVFAVLVAIGGCGSGKEGSRPEGRDDGLHEPVPTLTELRGELIPVAGGYAFRPCGSPSPRAATDRTGGDLPTLWRTLGVDSTVALFIQALGDTTGDSVAVHQIRRAAAGGQGCGESFDYIYRAHGNEPFWSITVRRSGIIFEQPDEPRRIEFPYVEPYQETYQTPIYRTVAGGDTLTLTLEPRRCQDSMSGWIFPLTARAQLRGRVLHGCAGEGRL